MFVPFIVEGVGFGLHQAEEAGCDRGGALEAVVVVPNWDEALFLGAADVWGETSKTFVLRTSTKVALPIVWAVDGAVVRLGLETFVAEDGLFECRTAIR